MAERHARTVQYPFTASLQGALLDSYEEDARGKQMHLRLKIRALERTASELFERDGAVHERLQGHYIPAQLDFSNVAQRSSDDFFRNIKNLPINDAARTVYDLLSWRQPGRRDVFYVFGLKTPQAQPLMFFAGHVTHERLSQESIPCELERDWCPSPPMPERLVPQPVHLYRRFGGDPITIHVNGRVRHRKLFVGGVESQPEHRPQVDVVLNVGEDTSRWTRDGRTYAQDRWDHKGEGAEGMPVEVIRQEAKWVIDHLQNNRTVLVHCAAGLNRSTTICCAVLILLEGLSAEAALQRVREHHPWAKPDAHHWLHLRWLAENR